MPISVSELIQNRTVQAALAIVAIIAAISVTYYLVASHEPALAYVPAQVATVSQTVTATGVVSPIQNPTLTFTSGGRVTYVNAVVGKKVYAGTVLASLDTGVLSAERAAAQASLDKLVAGPRAIDLAGKQTAVASAQSSRAAAEASYPAAINSARSSLESAVGSTDPLFNNPNTGPELYSMYQRDTDVRKAVDDERKALNRVLDKLDTDHATALDADSALDLKTNDTLAALSQADTYLGDLSNALNGAKTDSSISGSQVANAITTVNASRASVNTAIRELTDAKAQAAGSSLAVTSAQNDLSLAAAPARSEDVRAAQAQLASVDAQIREAEIIAPFSGTIAAVNVKAGDVLAPNTDAISLIPNGTSEVDVYLTEREVAMLMPGDQADVTLDAFGSSRMFPATVSTIDRAPSVPIADAGDSSDEKAAQGYKVTLVFTKDDPSIGLGMHANATIHGRSKEGVLSVPHTSVITDGAKMYVLKKTDSGVVKTEVSVGLLGTDSTEIVSGLAEGDMVAKVGSSNNE